MMVSEVGLIAMGSFKSLSPLLVTQATSGEKPSKCFSSFLRAAYETNMGK
jgi:hypothetical protein